jgi:hypothetical protein
MIRAKRPVEVEEVDPDSQEAPQPQPVEEPPALPRFLDDHFPNPKAMDVWEYMETLTPEQWQEHIGYLYRTNPTLSLTGGQSSRLQKFVGPITMEDVEQEYGGIGFRLDLKRGKERVYCTRFNIEAKPKLKAGETVEGKAADTAAAASGDRYADRHITYVEEEAEQAKAKLAALDPSNALRESMKLMGEGQKLAMESIIKSLPVQPSMTDQITAMVGIMKLVAPAAAPQGNSLIDTIKALKDLGLIGQPPVESKLDKVMDKLLEKMVERELEGGDDGGGRRPDWKTTVAEALAGKAPELLARVENTVRLWSEGQATRAAASGVRIRPAPVLGGPSALGGPASGGQPATPAAVGGATTAEGTAISPEQYVAVLQDRVKQMVVGMLFGNESGEDAAFAAASIFPEYAKHLAQLIKAKSPELANDPILRAALRSPQLEEFARDFVAYFAEEEEPTAAPAATG